MDDNFVDGYYKHHLAQELIGSSGWTENIREDLDSRLVFSGQALDLTPFRSFEERCSEIEERIRSQWAKLSKRCTL